MRIDLRYVLPFAVPVAAVLLAKLLSWMIGIHPSDAKALQVVFAIIAALVTSIVTAFLFTDGKEIGFIKLWGRSNDT